MKWLLPWLKPEPTIRFKSIFGAPHISPITAVRPAGAVKPAWIEAQRGRDGMSKFANCPGMWDHFTAGYIIPAWTDITIKANKAGIVVKLLDDYGGTSKAVPMNQALLDGFLPEVKTAKFLVTKIPMPWGIYTKPGWSAYCLPAIFHSTFLNDLHVYTGVVDYDVFHVANLIISPLRECEVQIRAGDPLVQVIPFRREKVTAVCGPATKVEQDVYKYGYPTRIRAAYRRLFHQRKVFEMEHQQ